MHRSSYKRGWFGESHRHYLAAKGIRTGENVNAELARLQGKDELAKLHAESAAELIAKGRLIKLDIQPGSDAYEEELNRMKGALPEPPRVAQKSPVELRMEFAARQKERERLAEEAVQARIAEAVKHAKEGAQKERKADFEKMKAEWVARRDKENEASEVPYGMDPEYLEILREDVETRPRQFVVEPDPEVEAVVQRKQDLLRLL